MSERQSARLRWRFASEDDAPALAGMNEQLIADEGHHNPMNRVQLERRMRGWLGSEYRAVLFERAGQVVAYALYRDDEWGRVRLRQFFVARHTRRQGIGSEALRLFRESVVSDRRVLLEVLADNTAGKAFWLANGFQEYAVTLASPVQE
jgi:ribosomal protein S18 acetylase RimI-like enzyme